MFIFHLVTTCRDVTEFFFWCGGDGGGGGGGLLLNTVLFLLSDARTLVYLLQDFLLWGGGGGGGEGENISVRQQTAFQDKTLGFILYVLVCYVAVFVFWYFDIVPVHSKNNTKADIKK